MTETPETFGGAERLLSMPDQILTCTQVDERDLEAGYLARRLSPEVAAAYEAHCFECDRCWRALQRATEMRAAFGVRGARGARARWPPLGLAAAAVLVLVIGAGLWLRREPPPTLVAMRGPGEALVMRTSASENSLSVIWSPVPGAEFYRVRLHDAAGDALFEREVADTVVVVRVDALEAPARDGALFWQVQAIDRLRQPLRRSALTAARPPSPALPP